MKGRYKAAVDRAPPPARVTLKQITAERVALYRQEQPPRDNNPPPVNVFPVEELVPTEDDINWAVPRLRNK